MRGSYVGIGASILDDTAVANHLSQSTVGGDSADVFSVVCGTYSGSNAAACMHDCAIVDAAMQADDLLLL